MENENQTGMTPDFRTAMRFAPYAEERRKWPVSGRHIMAQWDEESVIVYQAYRPAIARHAVQHQAFGGEFSYSRMSWIKPNFLWMMYRSGWAAKEGQEHVLAIRLARRFLRNCFSSPSPPALGPAGFPVTTNGRLPSPDRMSGFNGTRITVPPAIRWSAGPFNWA